MLHAGENAKLERSKEDYSNPAAQNFTLRTKRWRYIRYYNGMEELYDHDNDPHEWTNLAENPEFAQQKEQLFKQLKNQTGLDL